MTYSKRFILFINIILLVSFSYSYNFELNEVMAIGSDEPDYTFFSICAVDADEAGNIYIVDSKGCFIRKYSKKGKFIKETGRCGQGPGDLQSSAGIRIRYKNNKLYIHDSSNHRIVIYDKHLNRLKIIKLLKENFFRGFFVNKGLYYGPIFMSPKDARIVVYNEKGKPVFYFFKKEPDYINKNNKEKMYIAAKAFNTHLKMDYSKERKEFLITFLMPGDGENINLFFYDYKGQYLRKMKLNLVKGYKFPKYLMRYPLKMPESSEYYYISSLFFKNDKTILMNFVKVLNKKEKIYKQIPSLLLIDIDSGKIMEKQTIESEIRILNVKDNLIYATNSNDDGETLHIYRMVNEK